MWIFHMPLSLYAQNTDSLKTGQSDSLSGLKWQPKLLPELNQFNPKSITNQYELNDPITHKSYNYYNPENVMPKNFWEMDNRTGSYYTPRIVSDELAHMMDRLPPDSFVPLPTVALIAASIALQQLDIQKKIEIEAGDYLVDPELEPVLFSLWEKSPQTIKEIYESHEINKNRTVTKLKSDLQYLVDKKLVKIKKLENEPAKYFIAQDPVTVNNLIYHALEDETLTEDQGLKLIKLQKHLSLFLEKGQ
jgi:hypothetical protein